MIWSIRWHDLDDDTSYLGTWCGWWPYRYGLDGRMACVVTWLVRWYVGWSELKHWELVIRIIVKIYALTHYNSCTIIGAVLFAFTANHPISSPTDLWPAIMRLCKHFFFFFSRVYFFSCFLVVRFLVVYPSRWACVTRQNSCCGNYESRVFRTDFQFHFWTNHSSFDKQEFQCLNCNFHTTLSVIVAPEQIHRLYSAISILLES